MKSKAKSSAKALYGEFLDPCWSSVSPRVSGVFTSSVPTGSDKIYFLRSSSKHRKKSRSETCELLVLFPWLGLISVADVFSGSWRTINIYIRLFRIKVAEGWELNNYLLSYLSLADRIRPSVPLEGLTCWTDDGSDCVPCGGAFWDWWGFHWLKNKLTLRFVGLGPLNFS